MAIDAEEVSERVDIDESALMINRTGIMVNLELSAELIEGVKTIIPQSDADGEELRMVRAEYAAEAAPIGSYPAVVNGADQIGEDAGHLAVLLDKLSERLAFERQGTRLYEAFIQKVEALPAADADGPPLDELQHICDEELAHFKILQKAIVDLGGDATVQSPSADVAGVLSHGAMQIMSDPRTTIAQALQAALTAELTDNDGWEMLQELALQLGQDELAEQAAKAFEQEQEHLESVRAWISNKTLAEAIGAGGEREDEEDGKSKKTRTRSSKRKASRPKAKRKKK